MKSCPKCKSSNIESVKYRGINCVICKDCGFDERNIYEQEVEQKSSQKAKARFSPYKTGGKDRTRQ